MKMRMVLIVKVCVACRKMQYGIACTNYLQRDKMFDLIRTTEGTITKAEFGKGVAFVSFLTICLAAIFFLLKYVNSQMVWMTTAVAPFLGVIGAFVGFSILYFWTCLFMKRLRATKHPQWYVYIWLALVLLIPALQLVLYEIVSLALPDAGLLAISSPIALVLKVLFLGTFLGLIFLGFSNDKSE